MVFIPRHKRIGNQIRGTNLKESTLNLLNKITLGIVILVTAVALTGNLRASEVEPKELSYDEMVAKEDAEFIKESKEYEKQLNAERKEERKLAREAKKEENKYNKELEREERQEEKRVNREEKQWVSDAGYTKNNESKERVKGDKEWNRQMDKADRN